MGERFTGSVEMTERQRGQEDPAAATAKSVIVLMLLIANVLLFAPLAIYTGNSDEFSVAFLSLLRAFALPAAIVLSVYAAAATWLRPLRSARAKAVLSALVLLTWFQGSILVWNYGVFDGTPIQWMETGWRGILDTSVWLLCLGLAVYGYRRFHRMFFFAAVSTFFIQLVPAVSSGPDTLRALAEDSIESFDPNALDTMARFSSERNILHIVMDGFQADIFADIVKDPQKEALRTSLDGFTWFDNHIGSFPYTQMTMPLLVSGRVFRNEIPADEFTEKTMRGATILNAARESGYELDVATQAYLLNVYSRGGVSNAYPIPINLHTSRQDYLESDAARMLDLALFRVTPHFVKAWIYQDELWFIQRFASDGAFVNLRYFAELEFLRRIGDGLVADRRAPVYKLFHLMLSHQPTVGNAECRYDGRHPTSRHFVTLQATCGLKAVLGVLEAMKAANIYDDALIVLMADHGAWIRPTGYKRTNQIGGGPTASIAGLALPVLAIKPLQSRGPLAVSHAPTTVADVPQTIAELAAIPFDSGGRDVFGIAGDERRLRSFYDYAYGDNREKPGYLYTMLEYEIAGDPYDSESWRAVRRHFPGGKTEPVGQ